MSELIDSFHQLIAFVISPLTAFLQLKYHSTDKKETLFATHPTTMLVAVSSFMLYFILHVILLRSPTARFVAVAHLLFVCSAYVAVSALAAPLFPTWATTCVYAIFMLLSTGELFRMYGNKLFLIDEDEEEGVGGGSWMFRVYRKYVYVGGFVAKLFGQKPQPMLPT